MMKVINLRRRAPVGGEGATLSRRSFLGATAAAGAVVAWSGSRAWAAPSPVRGRRPNSVIKGVQIGVITYSFRSMSDQSAEALLQYCLQCGINSMELMGDAAEQFAGLPQAANPAREAVAEWRAAAPMTRFAQLRQMYRDAGVTIYAFNAGAFEDNSTDAEIDYGMRAAKALGAWQVTVELPTDLQRAKKLGDMAARHGLRVGYHGHLQASPTAWDAALAQSSANGINLDLGHFVAAGDYDGVAFIRDHHARITSMHLKDRKSKAHGRTNMPWGEGDTPIGPALRLIRDRKYRFPATIEVEYPIPAGSDAVKEVSRCLEYCREALST